MNILPNLSLKSVELTKLDQLYEIQTILNALVINNMLLTNTSSQAKIESFYNPNLYSLAVQFYGDDSLWTTIARANQLTDPQVNSGFITLSIPPKPALPSNGVLTPQQTTSN